MEIPADYSIRLPKDIEAGDFVDIDLLNDEPVDHAADVRQATEPKSTRDHVEAFLKDSGKISGLLKEGKHNKVTAFLYRHPVLTFVLGGATLVACGATFVAAAGVVVGGFAVGLAVAIVPSFLFPPSAPASLVAGVAIVGAFAYIGLAFAGIGGGVAMGMGGAGLAMAGVDLVAGPFLGLRKHADFQEKLGSKEQQNIPLEDIQVATEHVKRGEFLSILRTDILNPEERADLALRIKHDSVLKEESKIDLLTGLADDLNTQKLEEEFEGAKEWDAPNIENTIEMLKKVLPEAKVDELVHAPHESYAARCDSIFEALKDSDYTKAIKRDLSYLDDSPFHAGRVKQLYSIALAGKEEYYRQAFLNTSHDQVRALQQAAAAAA